MTGDFIKITNLKVFAHHGVFPEETRDGQDFYVNAKLFLDCRKAGKTDNLSDSLNYGEVSHFITDFLQDHTYKLIESVAEQLAEAMLLSMPVLKGVEIELCKPHAPIGLPFENVSVTMKRQWHEVYLAVGSNLGDKNAYIGNGIDELRRIKELLAVQNIDPGSLTDALRYAEYELEHGQMVDSKGQPVSRPVDWVFRCLSKDGTYPSAHLLPSCH